MPAESRTNRHGPAHAISPTAIETPRVKTMVQAIGNPVLTDALAHRESITSDRIRGHDTVPYPPATDDTMHPMTQCNR